LIAGVTRGIDTISPQFMWPGAQIASKIRSRVSSANAFDTFRGVTTEFKME
jgi:hypothetical protein